MIGNPIDRRRAERYSELLDEAEGGVRRHRRSNHDEDLAPLVNVGEALRQTGNTAADAAAPTPEFQSELRQRLMAVAAVQGIGATARDNAGTELEPLRPPKPPMSTKRRMVVAGALAVGVLGLSGVSTASADALPGDALYPVKRSAERAQLAMAGSEVNRGQLYFEFARTRLDEAGQVAADPKAFDSALSAMDTQLSSGMKALTSAAVNRQDAGVLDTIDEFLDGQSPRLADLLDTAPHSGHATLGDSMDLMDSAAERSQELREALLCSATFDDDDVLGPLPGDCGVLPGSGGTPLDEPDGDAPSPRGSGADAPHGNEESASSPDAKSPSSRTDDGDRDHPGKSPTASPSPTKTEGGLLGDIGDALDDLLGG